MLKFEITCTTQIISVRFGLGFLFWKFFLKKSNKFAFCNLQIKICLITNIFLFLDEMSVTLQSRLKRHFEEFVAGRFNQAFW